jgi:hypothetical protein
VLDGLSPRREVNGAYARLMSEAAQAWQGHKRTLEADGQASPPTQGRESTEPPSTGAAGSDGEANVESATPIAESATGRP